MKGLRGSLKAVTSGKLPPQGRLGCNRCWQGPAGSGVPLSFSLLQRGCSPGMLTSSIWKQHHITRVENLLSARPSW